MHESFNTDHRFVKVEAGKPECSLTYKGWGYFDIPMTLHWKVDLGGEAFNKTITFDHLLSFDGPGKWREVVICISKSKLQKLIEKKRV